MHESSSDLNEGLIKKADNNLKSPLVTLDIVLFTMYKDKLCVILVPKEINGKSKLVLPGGLITSGYSLEENFDDILYRKTGIKGVYKEQLYAFGESNRKEFGDHVISIAFFALINKNLFLNDVDLTKINIIEFNNLDNTNIGYDHNRIIKFARQRLKFRLEYTNISKDILPQNFTIPQLQKAYEIMFGEELDKRNFRRKIQELKIVKFTGKYDKKSSNRPAKLYEFVNKELKYLNEDLGNCKFEI